MLKRGNGRGEVIGTDPQGKAILWLFFLGRLHSPVVWSCCSESVETWVHSFQETGDTRGLDKDSQVDFFLVKWTNFKRPWLKVADGKPAIDKLQNKSRLKCMPVTLRPAAHLPKTAGRRRNFLSCNV